MKKTIQKAAKEDINNKLISNFVHSIAQPPQESPQSIPNDNDAQGLMFIAICED